MDEDEKIKVESPDVAFACSHTGNFPLFLWSKFAFVVKLCNLRNFARFEAIIVITPQRVASSACLLNKLWL